MSVSLAKLSDKEYRKDALFCEWLICKDWCVWVEHKDAFVDIGFISAVNSAMKFKQRGALLQVLKIQYTDKDDDYPSNEGIVLQLSQLSRKHNHLNKTVKAICVQELSALKEASQLHTYTKSVCDILVLINIIYYRRSS